VKASVVELIRSPQISFESFIQPTSPWQGRPSTPFGFCRKLEESSVASTRAPRQTLSDEEETPIVSQGPLKVLPSVFGHDGGFESTTPHAHSNRLPAPSHTYQNDTITQPRRTSQFNEEEPHDSIINAIRRAVRGFPQDMLFLNTPCVVQIRRQSHPSHQSAPLLQSLPNRSQESSEYRPPSRKPQTSSFRRRTMAAGIFASLERHHSTKHSSPELDAASVTSTIKRPPYTPTAPKGLSESEDVSSPDLTAFQKIFPSTDDWWRDVLYAYLVAYNYIQDIKVQPKPNISSKAYRTLGIPRFTSSRACPSERQDPALADLESDLASCINRVINCMAGRNNALRDTEEIRQVEKNDGLLLRALAEIVRVCEIGHRQEHPY
jgi:hypothetical protein